MFNSRKFITHLILAHNTIGSINCFLVSTPLKNRSTVAVGTERRYGQLVRTIEIARGIVGPAVAHSHGMPHPGGGNGDDILLDGDIGGMKLHVGATH